MTIDDDPRHAETRDWLVKSQLDLRAGRHDLRAEPPLLEDALFHAQQAAEKALKAFLVWHDQPFRKTHDLRSLGQQCVTFDQSLEQLMKMASRLSQYAWRYRYPGETEPPSPQEAERSLELAENVYLAVIERLPALQDDG
jgi:HEPN domain-containing protein